MLPIGFAITEILLSALIGKALHCKQFMECLGYLNNFLRFFSNSMTAKVTT